MTAMLKRGEKMKHRSHSQKARDGAIVKKLATEQEFSEEEEERLAQLILIAAENLGIIGVGEE